MRARIRKERDIIGILVMVTAIVLLYAITGSLYLHNQPSASARGTGAGLTFNSQ